MPQRLDPRADAGGDRRLYDAIVAYSGLAHFIDVPIKNYSSGMHMRLGFAIAANLDPDILLLDEIFAVGDDDFQKQCIGTLTSFQAQGKTILFVSHSPAAVRAICHRVCLLDRGHLIYDGPVDAAFSEYRRLTAATAGESVRGEPGVTHRPVAEGDPDLAWHRLAAGGHWAEEGEWVFDFLRRQGLRPEDMLLDVGCGSLSAATRLLPYMERSHYWGYEKDLELYIAGSQIELPRVGVAVELGHFIVNDDFDFSDAPHPFNVALASSLFRRLTLNGIARCIAGVVKKLAPDGRFYATWLDNPDPLHFGTLVHGDGTKSYSDRDPFHYSFAVLSGWSRRSAAAPSGSTTAPIRAARR